MVRCCSNITIWNGASPFMTTVDISRFSCSQAHRPDVSWSLVLKKREGYRRAFDKFDPEKVARYSERRIRKLASDPAIIRNRTKIEAAVRNARAFLKIQEGFGDFDSYCWRFVGGRPKLNHWKAARQIPATSPRIRGI